MKNKKNKDLFEDLADEGGHPIESLVTQMNQFFELIKTNKIGPKKGEMPKEMNLLLEGLKSEVGLLKQVTDDTIADMGMDKAELRKKAKETYIGMQPSERESMDRMTHLRKEGNVVQLELQMLSRALDFQEKEKKPFTGKHKATSKEIRKRKLRFRRAGGKKNWKPI